MMIKDHVLDLGSDLALRYRHFTLSSLQHPAKLHLGLLTWLVEHYTRPGETIADPMAGIGSLLLAATMQRHVIVREIEEEWLVLLRENAARIQAQSLWAGAITIGQADARQPWDFQTDHLLFSPPCCVMCSMASDARLIRSMAILPPLA